MTTPSDIFMGSRIPYLVRKCEDALNPDERMGVLAEIESEVEAYAAKRRVEAMRECVTAAFRVYRFDTHEEHRRGINDVRDVILDLISKETP